MYNYDYFDSVSTSSSINQLGTWSIVALIIAIIGGIVLYFTVFSEKNKSKYNGFMAKLYNFVKFKELIITGLLRVLYLIIALYITLSSFALIGQSFLAFIIMLVVGNIILRIVFEYLLVLLGIYENTHEIAVNTKKK